MVVDAICCLDKLCLLFLFMCHHLCAILLCVMMNCGTAVFGYTNMGYFVHAWSLHAAKE